MIKILSWNIVSLRAMLKKNNIIDNKESIKNTFENFIKKNKFDIICLQEIKLCDNTINILLDLLSEEYPYKYYNIPHTKKGYSGVAILSKSKALSHSTNFDDTLGRYLKTKFKNFYLINLYATNAGPNLERLKEKHEFNKKFYTKMQKLKSKKEVLIVGDFNAIHVEHDSYDFKKHYNKLAGVTDIEIKDLNKLLDNGFINVFREKYPETKQYSYFTYRWPSRKSNKGLLIDFALATNKLSKKVKKIKYLDKIYGSDHLPLYLELEYNL
jgi:exodeoxyribonuclease III